jgi:hypothetical protein
MPLRLSYKQILPPPGSLLYNYWGPAGFHRPIFDVFLLGPGSQVARVPAQVDSASDWVVFPSSVAHFLGLVLPFPRQVTISGVAGVQATTFSFPPDGLVSLFVTDYTEYAFLSGPMIGFHAHGLAAANQRSVLGLTGFLQFFLSILDPNPTPPVLELHPIAAFPGRTGLLPKDRGLSDFIRSLRAGP